MKYTTTREEQETHITWNEETKQATIYSASTVMMRKFDRLCEEFPDTYKCIWIDKHGLAKKYSVSSNFIRFGKPRTMSDEQKEQARQRMIDYQSNKAQESEDDEDDEQ